MVRYTVRNIFIQQRWCRAVKLNFGQYIPQINFPNENIEYGYPNSNALLQFYLKLECCKPLKVVCRPTKGDVIKDVKLFLTVYCRISCCKYLMLSNQMLSYKIKCTRIMVDAPVFVVAPKIVV